SGKDTRAKELLKKDVSRKHIVISDIVRKITSFFERNQDSSLDTQIIEELKIIFENALTNNEKLLINGIRQKTIYKFICDFFKERGIEHYTIWLDVSREERKQRFLRRKDPKDTLTFEYYDQRDILLGVEELREYLIDQNSKGDK